MAYEDKRRIREFYELLSGSYDELYGEEQSKKLGTILSLLGNLKLGVVVDVGCGTGEVLKRISTRCSMVVGIDLSERMLRRAKQRVGNGTGEFVVADCSALPLRSGVSDCVLSVSVLGASSDENEFLELSRIASDRGTVLVTVLHPGDSVWTEKSVPLRISESVSLTARESLCVLQVSR